MLLRDDSADQNETEVDFLQLECHRPLKRVKSLLLNDTNFIVYHVLVQRVLQFQSCKGSQSAAWSIHEASNKLIYLRHFFFFSLFHQRADDEALTRFLQTSLFLVASPILVKSMFLSFRSSSVSLCFSFPLHVYVFFKAFLKHTQNNLSQLQTSNVAATDFYHNFSCPKL